VERYDGALQNLAANGVKTSLIVRADEPTGCAFITVDPDGENAITVASGANILLYQTPADTFAECVAATS
jgi:sugar/nucleoside kinase (ribokinase family)